MIDGCTESGYFCYHFFLYKVAKEISEFYRGGVLSIPLNHLRLLSLIIENCEFKENQVGELSLVEFSYTSFI